MTTATTANRRMRVYPMDSRSLSQEQIAVTFAKTSRSPEPFDEIAKEVSEANAVDFNERWVVGYGHASVAEHAVIHMAVENISRLACDQLEDNRLASYTEKSSRYQVIDRESYHIPAELQGHSLELTFTRACDTLFDAYHDLMARCSSYLKSETPQRGGEKDGAYNLRIRRVVTDHCRFVLPAATLTNVGVTINARALEHAITKLLSSDLAECKDLGARLKEQGRSIAPTLVKYADHSEYLTEARRSLGTNAIPPVRAGQFAGVRDVRATLVDYDRDAEDRLAAALLYQVAGEPYEQVCARARSMSPDAKQGLLAAALENLGPFDSPLREAEVVDYLFDLEMDYGAYREYKRHRMQTYLPQALTTDCGYVVPPIVEEAGLVQLFHEAMGTGARAYHQLADFSPAAAGYVVTHAHLVRLLAKLNLRECYHLIKLRAAKQAHFTIQDVARQMLRHIEDVHPLLIRYIQLRDPM